VNLLLVASTLLSLHNIHCNIVAVGFSCGVLVHFLPTDFPTIFGIREAIQDQHTTLGWNNFILGRWSPKWQKAQQNYYNLTRSKRTSKRWATAIIHKLLLTVWDQWQFRNSIAHSDEGPISIALHRQLNGNMQLHMKYQLY
jgi:hypothetical protein